MNTRTVFEMLSWVRYKVYKGELLPLFELHDEGRPLIEVIDENNELSDDEEESKKKSDEFTALDLPIVNLETEIRTLNTIKSAFEERLAKMTEHHGTLEQDEEKYERHTKA